MKKSILIGLFAVLLMSCGGNAGKNKEQGNDTKAQATDASMVNVYYFHGKQRCKTCMAVEAVAKKTIEDGYATNNKVKFIEVDTSDKQNEALVEKYEVSWNALIIAKGENSIDITDRAFASAVNSPETLTNLIKEEVNSRLK